MNVAKECDNLRLICRFCLRIVNKAIHLTEHIYSPDGVYNISLHSAIAYLLPEVSHNIPLDTMCCYDCMENLRSALFFRNMCIQTEMAINSYAARANIPHHEVKLADVLIDKFFKQKNGQNNYSNHKIPVTEYTQQQSTPATNENVEEQKSFSEGCGLNPVSEALPNNTGSFYFGGAPEIQSIIENIPEVEDIVDVPDLLSLDDLVKYNQQAVSILQAPIMMDSYKRLIFPKNNVKAITAKKILLYPCKFCNIALRSLTELEKHMSTHVSMKNACMLCSVCHFYIPKKLGIFHMDLHSNILPCDICKVSFDIRNFTPHMRLHYPQNSGEHKLCSICYHQFPMEFFSQHLNIHKLGVPVITSNNFRCQICMEMFDFFKLEEHMKQHIKK